MPRRSSTPPSSARGKRRIEASCILGIDIGGTFTDFVLLEEGTGRVTTGKVLTRTTDLAAGVLLGMHELLARHGIAGSAVRKVVHGTTLATNALIERRGARTGLIVTRGFRDILELARESRYDIFDIDLEVPMPLVPRRRVFEVTERLARGRHDRRAAGDCRVGRHREGTAGATRRGGGGVLAAQLSQSATRA